MATEQLGCHKYNMLGSQNGLFLYCKIVMSLDKGFSQNLMSFDPLQTENQDLKFVRQISLF